MTTELYHVHMDTTADERMTLMTEKNIRHLPVREGWKLVGVISIGGVVKTIISEQKAMIENLENCIMGKYPLVRERISLY
jgi:CBS domain-containing protein